MRRWAGGGHEMLAAASMMMLLLMMIVHLASGLTLNVGTTALKGSLAYESLRYAVERWNSEQAVATDIRLRIESPSSGMLPIEERVCEVIQHSIIALIVPPSESQLDSPMLHSMCHHLQATGIFEYATLQIPCIAVNSFGSASTVGDFLTQMGPRRGLAAKATREFIDNLRWTSFLLAYQGNSDLEDVGPLMFDRTEGEHSSTLKPHLKEADPKPRRTIVKVKRLPNTTDEFEPFLKYVQKKLKQTNIVIHSNNITILYSLIQLARGMNMTEQPYSYVFTHTDLSLLEDFLNNIYGVFHCNITGLQLVKNDPMMKTELALTIETISAVGHAAAKLKDVRFRQPNDTWHDGRRMHEAIRGLKLSHQVTGEISFDQHGLRQDMKFYGIGRINSQFVKLGNWSETHGWQFDARYANRWEFDIDPDAENLTGLHLRVVVYLEEPFVIKTDRGEYEGFCIDLLNEMARVLMFNYTIIEVQDGTYGIEDDSGRWNGIIGVLQRHEADLSVSAVTITYSRVEVIDFTLPFMHLGISILLARSQEDSSKSSLFTFLEPLSLTVWVSLIGAYLSVSFTMYLLARFSPYEWYDIEKIDERDPSIENQKNQFSMLNSLWFAVGSLMQQGSDVIPRAAATRVVAVIWWMFTQILISSYTAQLAAFLTVERMTTPIESTADLASQTKIKYGTLKAGSTMDFFRESKIPIYERMWSIMESSSPTVFVNSSREGIARVKAGNYAYMMESSMLEYYMERDCELQRIGGLLDSKGYGIALPKGSPLRDIMSRTILHLQERTILESLKVKWWRDRRDLFGDYPDGPSCTPSAEAAQAHSLQSVFGIFYVLLTGLIVALLMSIGEYCIESRHDSYRLKLTILGKIVDWYKNLTRAGRMARNRQKLRNINLDTAGVEAALKPATSSAEVNLCLIKEPSMSRESLRRLSRMLPANDENLLHRKLRNHSIGSFG